MIETLLVVVLLTGLNVYQLWYWSRQCQRLIDKIMSKNYTEFVQTENLAKPSPPRPNQSLELDPSDPLLDELNSMI